MSELGRLLTTLPRNAEERQVQAVRRRLFESAHQFDVDSLRQTTKLGRNIVIDALIMCTDMGGALPVVAVHAIWTEWAKAMAFTGSSEYRTFPQYLREKVAAMQEQRAQQLAKDYR